MRLQNLSLALLTCCLPALGCLITTADDDDSDASTGNGPNSDPTTGADTGTDQDPAVGAPGCGWGPLVGQDVPEGYQCGIDGDVDPNGAFARNCSPDAVLEVGGDCIASGVTAEGCCDANGDVWYCVDPDGDGPMLPQVGTEDCAEPDSDSDSDSDTDSDTSVDTDDGVDTDSDSDSGSETDTDTDSGPDTDSDTDPGSDTDSGSDTDTPSETDSGAS